MVMADGWDESEPEIENVARNILYLSAGTQKTLPNTKPLDQANARQEAKD